MPLSLPLFRKLRAHTPGAAELLALARELQSEGRLGEAEVTAVQALAQKERAVGHRDPSLVPYLLLCAGVAYQRHGWGAGRPFYDRAQALRGPAPRQRVPGAPARATG
jgi:hypothetical protein